MNEKTRAKTPIDINAVERYFAEDSKLGNEKKFELLAAARTQLNAELTMLWTRAGYFSVVSIGFLAFIGSALNVALLQHESSKFLPCVNVYPCLNTYQYWLLVMLSTLGFLIVSFWLLSNIGSKFWYEEWEEVVKAIEKSVYGFKFYTCPRRSCLRISLSKLSIYFSGMFVLVFWLLNILFYYLRASTVEVNLSSPIMTMIVEVLLLYLLYSFVKFAPKDEGKGICNTLRGDK